MEYPGVGPELSFLKESGRAEFCAATDEEALDGMYMPNQNIDIIYCILYNQTMHKYLNISCAMTMQRTRDYANWRVYFHL